MNGGNYTLSQCIDDGHALGLSAKRHDLAQTHLGVLRWKLCIVSLGMLDGFGKTLHCRYPNRRDDRPGGRITWRVCSGHAGSLQEDLQLLAAPTAVEVIRGI